MSSNNYYQKYRKYKEKYQHGQQGQQGQRTPLSLKPSKYTQSGGAMSKSPDEIPTHIGGCSRVVYFFDNDARNFQDQSRCICVIPVDINESEKKPTLGGGYVFTDLRTYQGYIDSLSGGAKKYGEVIKQRKGIDLYDPKSGISSQDLKDYLNKLENSSFRQQLAGMIFDWDRTLTVIEGVPARYKSLANLLTKYQMEYGLDTDVTTKDVAEYYFGGGERLNLISKLFKRLHHYQIPIYVLSANSGLVNHTDFFQELLTVVGGGRQLVNRQDLMFKGHLTKYQFIQKILSNLCQGR